MQVSEILRKVADIVDAQEATTSAETKAEQAKATADEAQAMAQAAAEEAQAMTPDTFTDLEQVSVDNSDGTSPETMVPPLQQKHELLKKATGVENNVNSFSNDDEIAILKNLAGVNEPSPELNVADSISPVEINPKMNAALIHFSSDNYDAE